MFDTSKTDATTLIRNMPCDQLVLERKVVKEVLDMLVRSGVPNNDEEVLHYTKVLRDLDSEWQKRAVKC